MYPDSHAILIVDHDDSRGQAIAGILRDEGFPVTIVAEGFAGLRAIGEDRFSLVIAAMHLPGTLDGVAMMRRARAKRPGVRFLLVAEYPDVPVCADARRRRRDRPRPPRPHRALGLLNRPLFRAAGNYCKTR